MWDRFHCPRAGWQEELSLSLAVLLQRVLLQVSRGSSPLLHPLPRSVQLGPARVVNVLIAALMSCKWDPTSRYIRVMSSHLTNGDLIELLIGCLFPPRFMTPRPGLSGEGEVRQCQPRLGPRPAPGPAAFPGTSSLHLSARKNKQFEAPVSLLNISFKLHTLAPCPNAPRKHPQSSSAAGWSEQPPEGRAPAARGVPRACRGRARSPGHRDGGERRQHGGPRPARGCDVAARWVGSAGQHACQGRGRSGAEPGHRAG